jgi:hypothetical protein
MFLLFHATAMLSHIVQRITVSNFEKFRRSITIYHCTTLYQVVPVQVRSSNPERTEP